ncbi:uroporphyrinogen-III synthase [Rickettsia endosymbiont of Cardiosporidium cionae]|uniref:hypothetical protein n=1 Tax=Rickettsia endosymbiont of Cardiosporidium cionae TaxID=2777155 RepID=UPI001895BB86|nr:hypothetical protein [Rickettsia endosymbiont of Cardiosporidium cionae]KAF8818427.1 hypothetical protein IHI24_000517 [Rickettsia endosymbiont of Cardiosporidium cionae]
MRILLTRSKQENLLLMKVLSKRSFNCFALDLITFVDLEFYDDVLSLYSDIIITSKYAAIKLKPVDDYPYTTADSVWVVGSMSASILQRKGYKVKYIASNIDDLVNKLPSSSYQDMIYLSGEQYTRNLPESIRHLIFYKVEYLNILLDYQLQCLQQKFDYVMLYSKNTALFFVKLLYKYGLFECFIDTTFIVMSTNVKLFLCQYFDKILLCTNSDSMVECLEKYSKLHKPII